MQQPPPVVPLPPPPPPLQETAPPATPGSFDRDIFLLRQKHLSIKEKYYVADEHGNKILYAERPKHVAHNLVASIIALATGIAVWVGVAALTGPASGSLETVIGISSLFFGALTMVVVSIALSMKRHVIVFVDDTKQTQLMEIKQDKKFQFPKETYTVMDASGAPIARLATRFIYDIIRKRWDAFDPHGNHISVIREDSIGKAIARRLLGPLFGALRTNFFILDPQERPLGAFNREWTLFDRYVLDLRPDQMRILDRRVALAIGLMLDTGEKR